MKIQNKLPKFSESSHEERLNNEWNPLKEPQKASTAILLSIPLMYAYFNWRHLTVFRTNV